MSATQTTRPTTRRYVIFGSIACAILLAIWFSSAHRDQLPNVFPSIHRLSSETPWLPAANATLGFERIIALTTGTPWRVNGLHAAAALTGLQIDVPTSPPISPQLVGAFEKLAPNGSPRPMHGAALAWLAHLDIAKHIIQSGWTSALVVEDDIDWDVALKTDIMLPMAEGVRNYTNAPEGNTATPYGPNWDVIWMGHCGEWSHDDMPYLSWPDKTVIPHNEYVGWAVTDLKARIPEGVRTTHPTTSAVCTFAYGVTREGAFKILEHVSDGIGEGFDTALSVACRAKKLHCITIHPEIFHQYEPPRHGNETSEVAVLNGEGPAEVGDFEGVMGSTPNIRHSARCRALYNSDCQQKPR